MPRFSSLPVSLPAQQSLNCGEEFYDWDCLQQCRIGASGPGARLERCSLSHDEAGDEGPAGSDLAQQELDPVAGRLADEYYHAWRGFLKPLQRG